MSALDLQIFKPDGELFQGLSPIKKLRQRHHQLARLLADGMTNIAAATATGMSKERVSQLLSDPTFQDLVAYYSAQKAEQYLTMHERLADLGATAAEELTERLEDTPEQFDNKELLSIIQTAADRTGFGPQTKSTNLNINVGLAARMQEAMKRARKET